MYPSNIVKKSILFIKKISIVESQTSNSGYNEITNSRYKGVAIKFCRGQGGSKLARVWSFLRIVGGGSKVFKRCFLGYETNVSFGC